MSVRWTNRFIDSNMNTFNKLLLFKLIQILFIFLY